MRTTACLLAALVACRPDTQIAQAPILLSPLPPFTGSVDRFASTPLISPRLPDGSFLVTIPWASTPELPVRFDASARYAGTIGRFGGGPGEYQGPQVVLASGDSAIVFDNRALRATVLLGDRPIRTWPLPTMVYAAIRLADGTFVVSQAVMRLGPSLFHLAPDGTVLQAFGDSITATGNFPQRLLAEAPDGSFWSAREDSRCDLRHWSAPGQLAATFAPCGDWFPPYAVFRGPSPDAPPVTMLRGLWVDAGGRLWLAAQVADARFREGVGQPKTLEGQTVYAVTNSTLVWDGLLVAYTPDGHEIARLRADTTFSAVPESGVVVQHAYDADGWVYPRRYLASLREPL